MGKTRELRARIKSVRNTRKITRTMELVATAKAKVTQDRVKAVVPYGRTLLGMVATLVAAGARHPLLGSDAPTDGKPRPTVLFGITGNRGLCGGYNGTVIRQVRDGFAAEQAAGRPVLVHMAGKKGLSTLRFLKIPIAGSYTQFDDRPKFEAVAAVAEPLERAFAAGAIGRVELISFRYVSAGQQRAERLPWLPITPPSAKAAAIPPLLHPDPATLLESLLPLVARTALFQAFVEAAACEQIARRVAMKSATDNADDMTRDLTREYNRARQAGITQEIAEVIGGAAALE